jgi:hypothetical protein
MMLTPVTVSLDEVIIAVRKELDDRLAKSEYILDGVKLEELVNFDVPLLSAQSADQQSDGVLLSYKDGKLVEENNLNGGSF